MFTDIESFGRAIMASGLPPRLRASRPGEKFRAGLVTGDLGPLRHIDLLTPGGESFRDEGCLRDADEDLWQIELMTRGRSRIVQGGHVAELGPSDFVLVDPARPVRFASTAARHVTLLLPRPRLRLRPRDAERLAGVRIRGDAGPAALASTLIRTMADSLSGFRPEDAERSAAAVTELIAVALESRLGEVRPGPDDELRSRVVGFIEARLSDPDLAPASIAAAHHLSVRRLHQLFADEPLTLSALIRQRRLQRCHVDLARTGRTVASVATSWGFTNPAHFSRLFKATYGYSPATLTPAHRARAAG